MVLTCRNGWNAHMPIHKTLCYCINCHWMYSIGCKRPLYVRLKALRQVLKTNKRFGEVSVNSSLYTPMQSEEKEPISPKSENTCVAWVRLCKSMKGLVHPNHLYLVVHTVSGLFWRGFGISAAENTATTPAQWMQRRLVWGPQQVFVRFCTE